MKKIYILAAAAVLLSLSSCMVRVNNKAIKGFGSRSVIANGVLVSEHRDLPAFDNIAVKGSLDVNFVQREGEPGIDIEISENILPYILSEVEDRTLTVRFHSDSISSFTSGKSTITVYAPDLSSVSVVGSGDFNCLSLSHSGDFSVAVAGSGDSSISGLQCDGLNLSIAGSGDIKAQNVVAGAVSVAVAGSGDVVISGTAESANYSVVGSGDIRAAGLNVSGSVNQSVKGSGDIITK